MIFKHRHIVVEDGQLGSALDFKYIVGSWVINIVGCSRNESAEDVNLAHLADLVDILLVQHEEQVLYHIGRMDLVVVRIVPVDDL